MAPAVLPSRPSFRSKDYTPRRNPCCGQGLLLNASFSSLDTRNAPVDADRIVWLRLSACVLLLAAPISDAKVLTGRQKPLTEVALRLTGIATTDGHQGLGLGDAKRAGGPALFAHARALAPLLIGEDPNDIARLWGRLCWAGAGGGRSGLAVQAIGAFDLALWDCKARRAALPLAKLLGAQRDSRRERGGRVANFLIFDIGCHSHHRLAQPRGLGHGLDHQVRHRLRRQQTQVGHPFIPRCR